MVKFPIVVSFRGEILPQWRQHQRLLDFVVFEKLAHLSFREQVYGDVLRGFKMLHRCPFHAFRHEAVYEVVHVARVARDDTDFAPCAARISRLLVEFAPCGGLRRSIGGVDHAGHDFVARSAQSRPVLSDEDEIPVGCPGNDVDPVGKFQNVIFIVDNAVRQLHRVAPCRQPRPSVEIFAFEHFPGSRVFFFHNELWLDGNGLSGFERCSKPTLKCSHFV